jgi:hypothetical protein
MNAASTLRHGQGLQLMPVLPLRQGTELVGQVREQQGAKRRIAEAIRSLTACLASWYATTSSAATNRLLTLPATSPRPSKQSSGPNVVKRLVAIKLLHEPLDDDKQVCGLRPQGQNGLAAGESRPHPRCPGPAAAPPASEQSNGEAEKLNALGMQRLNRFNAEFTRFFHCQPPGFTDAVTPSRQDAWALVPPGSFKPGIPLQIGAQHGQAVQPPEIPCRPPPARARQTHPAPMASSACARKL